MALAAITQFRDPAPLPTGKNTSDWEPRQAACSRQSTRSLSSSLTLRSTAGTTEGSKTEIGVAVSVTIVDALGSTVTSAEQWISWLAAYARASATDGPFNHMWPHWHHRMMSSKRISIRSHIIAPAISLFTAFPGLIRLVHILSTGCPQVYLPAHRPISVVADSRNAAYPHLHRPLLLLLGLSLLYEEKKGGVVLVENGSKGGLVFSFSKRACSSVRRYCVPHPLHCRSHPSNTAPETTCRVSVHSRQ